jgi:hypothetical protein
MTEGEFRAYMRAKAAEWQPTVDKLRAALTLWSVGHFSGMDETLGEIDEADIRGVLGQAVIMCGAAVCNWAWDGNKSTKECLQKLAFDYDG